MGKSGVIRNAEKRAIESVARITNSLMLAHYFVEDQIAYYAFVGEMARRDTTALETVDAFSDDIETIEAILLVLQSLKSRLSSDVEHGKSAVN